MRREPSRLPEMRAQLHVMEQQRFRAPKNPDTRERQQ